MSRRFSMLRTQYAEACFLSVRLDTVKKNLK
nr:MAG TPA: hypothetical protein [Caudoviricetes sp.]